MTYLVEKRTAQAITREIDEAVTAILKKHNFQKSSVRSNYGDSYRFRIEATPLVEGDNGVNLTSPEAQEYQHEVKFRQSMYEAGPALDPDAVGKTFTRGGVDYVFVGMNRRARTYPYLARRVSDGKTYKFSAEIEVYLRAEKEGANS